MDKTRRVKSYLHRKLFSYWPREYEMMTEERMHKYVKIACKADYDRSQIEVACELLTSGVLDRLHDFMPSPSIFEYCLDMVVERETNIDTLIHIH